MTKPHVTTAQYQLLARAKSMMFNAQRQFRRDDFSYTGRDYQADVKHTKAWRDYGWPSELTFFMHWNMWRRHSIGSAVVSLPVKLCWMTKPEIRSSEKEHDEDVFESQMKKLVKRLKLWQRLRGGDLRQRVGRYGALVMTVADGKKLSEPLGVMHSNKVLSAKPVFEDQLRVSQAETDETSIRYGQPIMYTLNENDISARSQWNNRSTQIHWTRVIPLAEGADDGTIYGIPTLENIFNDLIDWDKVKGSGGEGFWRAAAQKFILQASKDSHAKRPSPDELDDLTDMLVDMFSGFDSMPYTGGWELKSLDTSMPTPDGFVAALEKSIAAGSTIPLKILFGSQTGVKAGDEDTSHFMRLLQSRRENELTDMVVDVVDWFDAHTTDIDKPEDLFIWWDDMTAPGAIQQSELGKKMSDINKNAVTSGQQAPFKTNEIREKLGCDPDEALDDDFELDETEDLEDDDLEQDDANVSARSDASSG